MGYINIGFEDYRNSENWQNSMVNSFFLAHKQRLELRKASCLIQDLSIELFKGYGISINLHFLNEEILKKELEIVEKFIGGYISKDERDFVISAFGICIEPLLPDLNDFAAGLIPGDEES